MKKKRFINRILYILASLALVFSSAGCLPSLPSGPTQAPVVAPSLAANPTNIPPSQAPAATPTDVPPTPIPLVIPYELVSSDSLFAYLEDLTSIQAYSGWRNSASSGEAEGLDYVVEKLSGFQGLQAGGLELERQSFDVFLSTEIWDAGLTLTLNKQEIKVPAEALRGHRFDRQMASYFDTDGGINDADPHPVTASGAPLLVHDEDTLYSLAQDELAGRILFLDYSLVDRSSRAASGGQIGANDNSSRLVEMINQGLAGVVLVTQYSNKPGQSHGMFASEGSIFALGTPGVRVPLLHVRLEDLGPAGIAAWADFEQIEAASLALDVDVFSPGKSGNVIARIPGADSSKAVILGAHMDTPNTAGAYDDGSGSASLLEIARVLDAARIQPAVDLYLAWFGSEELGIYGSAYFASTHQELLDRTLAMLQMDCLGHPLDGITSSLTLTLASYEHFGDDRLPLPDFLSETVAAQGISLDPLVVHGIESDNNNFEAFDVPNADLIYGRPNGYAIHIHDPYETVDRGRAVGPVFVEMTQVMLAAALEIGRLQPGLRVTPAQDRRALFVASHTEAFGITSLRKLGMALSMEGFDVDLLPYGQAITPADLQDVDIVVLPPGLNSPGKPAEKWGEAELALLQGYVAGGGLLVVVNSANNYASDIPLDGTNLNARAINALLEPMGVTFTYGALADNALASPAANHALTANATYLSHRNYAGVPFIMKAGLALFRAGGRLVVGLVDYGEQGGQVLVIADLGLLQGDSTGAKNVEFLKNIARYARTR